MYMQQFPAGEACSNQQKRKSTYSQVAVRNLKGLIEPASRKFLDYRPRQKVEKINTGCMLAYDGNVHY